MKLMPAFGRVFARCFALQAGWNYERMVGTGFGWAAEPALRRLGGDGKEERYREALARQSRYFNAHPYFTGLAIGAAVRAEHDGEPPQRIERLREALCGPLGSLGDRLIWAAWLPMCSAVGIALLALGARVWAALAFLALYNAVHLWCRWWSLREGWSRGMNVAGALSVPLLRTAGRTLPLAAAFCVGAALPMALAWLTRHQPAGVPAAAALGALAFAAATRLASARLSGVGMAAVVLALVSAVGLAWS